MRLNIALLVAAVITAVALLIGGNYYVNRDIRELTFDKLRYQHGVVQETVENFKKIQSPLFEMLVDHPQLLTFCKQGNRKPLEELFSYLVESNRAIMQLRFLDIDGNELVRVDRRRDGTITITDKNALQNKAHRDYFRTFSALPEGEIAFSDFDLNVENRQVERPFNPTLRGGTKIRLEDGTYGLIIVNYYMKEWLYEFGRFGDGNVYLVDRDDYFLLHPDAKWAWSRYTTPPRKAAQYFGEAVGTSGFGGTDGFRWVNERTVAFPLRFFGNDLTVLYALDYLPTQRYNEKSFLFALFVLLAVVLILLPIIRIVRGYIRRLNSERNRAEGMQAYLTSVFNNTFDSMIIINADGIIRRVNSVALKTFGYLEEELVGRNVKILVPQPHHDRHDDYIRSHDPSMTSKVVGKERELFGLRKDGAMIPISLGVTRLSTDTETLFIGSVRDLSAEHKSRQQFETVFSEAPLGIALVLPDGHFWRLNRQFCHIVDYSDEEMLQCTFKQITYPDDLETDTALIEQLRRGEIDTYTLEKRFITKRGKVVWVNLTVSATFVDHNSREIEYYIAMIEDITERKATAESLAKAQKGLIEAERLAMLGHWDWNLQAHTLYWSESMKELFGIAPGVTVDYHGFLKFVHPDDRTLIKNAVERSVRAHTPLDMHFRIVTPDGTEKVIHARGSIQYRQKTPLRIFGTCQDVTEIKRLEEKEKERERMFLHQSKLAAMGEMLGAIAHQWRQPLNSIGLIIQDLVSAYRHNDLDEAYFKESQNDIMEQLHYMSGTIDEFRTFFTQSARSSRCNLVSLIREVNKLYWAQAKAHSITIDLLCAGSNGDYAPCSESDCESEAYTITSYPAEIKQLLLNLIGNAKEAITALEEATPQEQAVTVRVTPAEEALTIEICDLAGGIEEAVTGRIFEPYFTTKEMGTGLGLYIARTLATGTLKGTLNYLPVVSEGKKGSIFRLTLPRNS